ncbi:hypothetical protein QTP88_010929 [Uroleucon formosanum]
MPDLAMLAVLLDEDEVQQDVRQKNIKKGRFGFSRHFKKKKDRRYQFNVLYQKIKDDISKQNTHFRESISAKEKLGICLRFLGTGDSYQTIAFSFRLGHSTVQGIVLEVCNAIMSKMKNECIPCPKKKDWVQISNESWEI